MYIFESVKQAKQVLQKLYKNNEIVVTPILKTLSQLPKVSDEETFYFGVLTFGSEPEKVTLNNLENNTIDILPNNQIIELFRSLTYEGETINGQFRGYELKLN